MKDYIEEVVESKEEVVFEDVTITEAALQHDFGGFA